MATKLNNHSKTYLSDLYWSSGWLLPNSSLAAWIKMRSAYPPEPDPWCDSSVRPDGCVLLQGKSSGTESIIARLWPSDCRSCSSSTGTRTTAHVQIKELKQQQGIKLKKLYCSKKLRILNSTYLFNSRLPLTVQSNFSYPDTYWHISVLFQEDAQFMWHASHTLFHYAASKSDNTAIRLFFILSFNWKTEENLGNAVFGLKFELRTPTTQGLVLIDINMYTRSALITAVLHKWYIFFSKFPASTKHSAKLTLWQATILLLYYYWWFSEYWFYSYL